MPLRTLDNYNWPRQSTRPMTPANVEVIILSSDSEDGGHVVHGSLQQQQNKKRRRLEADQNAAVDGGSARGKGKEKNGPGDTSAITKTFSSDPQGSHSRSGESSKIMVQLRTEVKDMKRMFLNMEKVSFHCSL